MSESSGGIHIEVGEPVVDRTLGGRLKSLKNSLANLINPPAIRVGGDVDFSPDIVVGSPIPAVSTESVSEGDLTIRLLALDQRTKELIPGAEGNRMWARTFADKLRDVMTHNRGNLNFQPESPDYSGTHWLSQSDVVSLAGEFSLPIMVWITTGHVGKQNFVDRHYLLGLRMPELKSDGSGYKVLVWDPFTNGERFFELSPEFRPELFDKAKFPSISDSMGFLAVWNLMAEPLVANQTYDYSLGSDPLLDGIEQLRAAKMARVQDDDYNCGYNVVFMAALRAGWKQDKIFDQFKNQGRQGVLELTGVPISTREEIMAKINAVS